MSWVRIPSPALSLATQISAAWKCICALHFVFVHRSPNFKVPSKFPMNGA